MLKWESMELGILAYILHVVLYLQTISCFQRRLSKSKILVSKPLFTFDFTIFLNFTFTIFLFYNILVDWDMIFSAVYQSALISATWLEMVMMDLDSFIHSFFFLYTYIYSY